MAALAHYFRANAWDNRLQIAQHARSSWAWEPRGQIEGVYNQYGLLPWRNQPATLALGAAEE